MCITITYNNTINNAVSFQILELKIVYYRNFDLILKDYYLQN